MKFFLGGHNKLVRTYSNESLQQASSPTDITYNRNRNEDKKEKLKELFEELFKIDDSSEAQLFKSDIMDDFNRGYKMKKLPAYISAELLKIHPDFGEKFSHIISEISKIVLK